VPASAGPRRHSAFRQDRRDGEAKSESLSLSKRHEWHWRNDPRFSKILNPKRIKLAFTDEIALKRWHSELNAIVVQATAKPPMGSSDDGQEVSKRH
jgi:hypothetical protein